MTILHNIDTKIPLFQEIEEQFDSVEAFLNVNKLKGSGPSYLYKFEGERDQDYSRRLRAATLFNYFKQNIVNATSVITRNPVEFSNLSPTQEEFLQNVDLQNRNINQWLEDTTFKSLAYGGHYILVDNINQNPNSQESYPYWVDIPANRVIGFSTERIDKLEKLTEFRFYETITDEHVFSSTQQLIDRVRRYYIEDNQVLYEIYENKGGGFQLIDQGQMQGIDFIPIVGFLGGLRESFMFSPPPFYDLLLLNLAHYNSYSQQMANLETTRLPILKVKSFQSYDDEGAPVELKIGPRSIITSDNPEFDIQYIESSGSALDLGFRDIQILEQTIKALGIGLEQQNDSGDLTATAMAIETATQHAFLKKIARRFEDELTRLMAITSLYLNETNIPNISIDISLNIEDTLNENNDGREQPEQPEQPEQRPVQRAIRSTTTESTEFQ